MEERMTMEGTDSLDAAAARVRELAPEAEQLSEVEIEAGRDLHSIWLDKASSTVYWAWEEPMPAGQPAPCFLEIIPAADAVDRIEEAITFARDRLEGPWWYGPDFGYDVEHDLDAVDEFHQVVIAAAAAEDLVRQTADERPDQLIAVMASTLNSPIELARRAAARAAAVRAYWLASQVNPDQRGSQAALARALGIAPSSLSEVLQDDRKRRDKIRAAAARERSGAAADDEE
jgi:DNA-binding transcriptional regulator YdaS (Cro superfamily)